jgi:hypothetical protein
MKLRGFAVLAVLLAALVVAGCGGGGKTTVIERTVTEKVPGPAPKEKGATEDAVEEKASAEEGKGEGGAESEQPSRILHLQAFRTPSGNIGCAMYEGGARCDIRKRDWKPLPRPANCSKEVDYGQGLAIARGGQATFVCAGDTALDPGGSALSYGTASEVGGSECISRSDGVTCVNQAGHGFFISVQSYQVF